MPPAETPKEPEPTAGAHHPLHKSPNHLQMFTFEDDNLSTHLVRNALGGGARDRVAGLLAIPAPESRRYRDDITVNVILFNTNSPASPRPAPASASAGKPDERQSKL